MNEINFKSLSHGEIAILLAIIVFAAYNPAGVVLLIIGLPFFVWRKTENELMTLGATLPFFLLCLFFLKSPEKQVNQEVDTTAQQEYEAQRAKEIAAQKAQNLQEEREKEQAIRDSSRRYLSEAKDLLSKKKRKSAMVRLDSSMIIWPKNEEAVLTKADLLMSLGKYEMAKDQYNLSMNLSTSARSRKLIGISKCFIQLKETEKAISLLYEAKETGDKTAEELYNKYNPEKRYVMYTRTLCCDGTTSTATGSGACSRHGGVCQWNSPTYGKKRKYKIE